MFSRRNLALAAAAAMAAVLSGCAAPAGSPGTPAGTGDRERQAVLHVDVFAPDGTLERCRTFGDEVPWDAAMVAIGPTGLVTTAFSSRPRGPSDPPSTLVLVTDTENGLAWSATVDGNAGCVELLTAAAFDADGRTWIAAKDVPAFPGAAPPTWIIRRFGPVGNLDWSRSACFGTCAGIVTALLPAGRNDVIVAGIEEKVTVVARFPPDGYPSWSWIDEGAHLTALAAGGSGSVHACGVRPYELGEAWEVVRFGPSGKVEWTRTYSGRAHTIHPARANAVAVDGNGNVVVGGSDTGPSIPPGEDWLLRKYTATGRLLWERSWNGLDNRRDLSAEAVRAVACGPAGVIYALGETRVNDGPAVPVLRKYSPGGDLLWSRTAPGTTAFALTRNGRAFAAGITRF